MLDDWITVQITRLIHNGKQAMDDIIREKKEYYDKRTIEAMKQDAVSYGVGGIAKQYLGLPSRKVSKYAKIHMRNQEMKRKSEMFERFDRIFNNWVNEVERYLQQISEWKNNIEPTGNSDVLINRFHNRIIYKNSDTNFRHGIKYLESLKNRNLIRNSEIEKLTLQHKEKKRKTLPNLSVAIIEKRREVNLLFKQRHHFELLKPNEMAIIDLGKVCKNEDDFTLCIQSLASLIDGMDVRSLKKSIVGRTIQRGSINALQSFLDEKYGGFNVEIIKRLRRIMSLRSKKYPVHQDSPAFITTLKQMGFHTYPPNWSKLWDKCREEYHLSLVGLHKCINK